MLGSQRERERKGEKKRNSTKVREYGAGRRNGSGGAGCIREGAGRGGGVYGVRLVRREEGEEEMWMEKQRERDEKKKAMSERPWRMTER